MFLTEIYKNLRFVKVCVYVICLGVTMKIYKLANRNEVHWKTVGITERMMSSTSQDLVIKMKPQCTFEAYKQVVQRTRDLPGSGHWTKDTYEPNICKFNTKYSFYNGLPQCLDDKNIKTIVTLGDSNGMRQTKAIENHFQHAGFKCSRQTGTDKPMKIFLFHVIGLNVDAHSNMMHFGCRTCLPRYHICQHSRTNQTVHLLLTILANYIDKAMVTVNLNTSNDGVPCTRLYNTSQSFTFGHFLQIIKPNLIIYFSPGHERTNLTSIGKHIQELKSLVLQYIPKYTFMVWVTLHWENMSRKPKKYQNKRYGPNNITTNELLYGSNQLLIEELAPLFVSGDRRFLLNINSWELAEQKPEWSQDGVHKQRAWYYYITHFILDAFCS